MDTRSAREEAAAGADPATEPAAVPGPGEHLRAAREAAGESIEAIAGALHITPAQIEALESDDYAKFPAPIFVSGYVRKYAAHLGLDPEPLLTALGDAGLKTPPIRSELTARFPAPPRRGLSRGARHALAAIAGVAALALVWVLVQPPLPPEPPAPQKDDGPAEFVPAPVLGERAPAPLATPEATSGPASRAISESPPAPAGPMDELVLRFSGSSWVEIVDVTGRRLAYRMGEDGDVLHLRGLAPFDILLGNAPNVAIDYNGAPYLDFPVSRQNVASFKLGQPGAESGDEQ